MTEIIYVDDDLADRHLAKIAHRDAHVDTPLRMFSGGAAFLEYLAQLPDDDYEQRLVLLDINMPGMNGFEVLAKLKQYQRGPSIMVWMFSNTTRATEHALAKAEGAERFLAKPAEPSLTVALFKEIDSHCRTLNPFPERRKPATESTPPTPAIPLRILLVEDSAADALLLRAHAAESRPGNEIAHVRTLLSAEMALSSQAYDCVLLDLHLPDAIEISGLSRLVSRWPHMPVLALTGQYDGNLGTAAIRTGAQDFLIKGRFDAPKLWAAIEFAITRQQILNQLQRTLSVSVDQAMLDPLTGLANRRAAEARYQQIVHHCQTQSAGCWVMMVIDMDGLKRINDQYGHAAGDEMLRLLAGAIKSTLRDSDLLARIGGDEFVVLLDHLPSADWAQNITARMRDAVSALPPLGSGAICQGASFGHIAIQADAGDFASSFAKADMKMYADKITRRTRTMLAPASPLE